MQCAACADAMARKKGPMGSFWMCGRCDARLGTIAFLSKSLEPGPLQTLWQEARAGRGRTGRPCPACRKAMREVPLLVEPDPTFGDQSALVDLDVCTACHLVFFDAKEQEQMPLRPVGLKPRGPAPPPPSRGPAPPELPDVDPLLMAKLDRIKRETDLPSAPAGWKKLVAIFAPVEVENPPLSRVPLVTWVLGALMVLAAVMTFGDLRLSIMDWGFIPSDPWRLGGLTLLTSFFVHAGPIHLLGNLWFLLMFGDNVEDLLGTLKYTLVLAGATLAGIALHTLADPSSSIPLVGASGGISGVMLFYALRFPRARLGQYLFFWFRFHWLELPAWLYMAFWVGLQLIGSFASLASHGGGVAFLAHLGGALVGVAAFVGWGRRA